MNAPTKLLMVPAHCCRSFAEVGALRIGSGRAEVGVALDPEEDRLLNELLAEMSDPAVKCAHTRPLKVKGTRA